MNINSSPKRLFEELNIIFPYKVYKDKNCQTGSTFIRGWVRTAYGIKLITREINDKLEDWWSCCDRNELNDMHSHLYNLYEESLSSNIFASYEDGKVDFNTPSEDNY